MLKDKAFNIRINESLKNEVDDMCDEIGLEGTTIMRALLKAATAFYKENGYLTLPLTVVPTKSKKQRAARADTAA